jgi:hypothetical protein
MTLVVPGNVIFRKLNVTRFARLKIFFGRRYVTDEHADA